MRQGNRSAEEHVQQGDEPTGVILALVLVSVVIFVITYIADLATPLGVPVWLLYLIPLALSFGSGKYYAVPTVCLVILLFLFSGLLYSPPGAPVFIALAARLVFAVTVVGMSVILWKIQRTRWNTGHTIA